MKTVIMNYKKTAIALATVVTLGLSSTAFAANTNETPAELKFVGKEQNLPLFQLKLNNSDNTSYIVTVKDGEGNVLFTEKLTGEKISRTYKLDSEDAEVVAGTTFEVTNSKTKNTSVYKIKNNVKIVTDVEVAKL
jgi:hypothetical protein